MTVWFRKWGLFVILGALIAAGALALPGQYSVPVLMYHNVERTEVLRSDTVSPANLEKQMKFIRDHGYRVISLDELVKGLASGRKFPRHVVAVAFDDGLKNNLTHAVPVLEKYKIPATFFVSPGFVGRDDFLDWADMRLMKEKGFHFGSHGMTQVYLPDAPKDKRLFEIAESKRLLSQELGQPIEFFAYPVGGYDDTIKSELHSAGYKAAFTTNRGSGRFNRDLFSLCRIRISDKDTSELILRVKLSGYYNLLRRPKKEK